MLNLTNYRSTCMKSNCQMKRMSRYWNMSKTWRSLVKRLRSWIMFWSGGIRIMISCMNEIDSWSISSRSGRRTITCWELISQCGKKMSTLLLKSMVTLLTLQKSKHIRQHRTIRSFNNWTTSHKTISHLWGSKKTSHLQDSRTTSHHNVHLSSTTTKINNHWHSTWPLQMRTWTRNYS